MVVDHALTKRLTIPLPWLPGLHVLSNTRRLNWLNIDSLSSSSLESNLLLISWHLLPPFPGTSKLGTDTFDVLRRHKEKRTDLRWLFCLCPPLLPSQE